MFYMLKTFLKNGMLPAHLDLSLCLRLTSKENTCQSPKISYMLFVKEVSPQNY